MNQLLASAGVVNVSQDHDAIYYGTTHGTPYSSYGHSGNEKEHGRIDRPKGKDQHEEPRGFAQKGTSPIFKMRNFKLQWPHR